MTYSRPILSLLLAFAGIAALAAWAGYSYRSEAGVPAPVSAPTGRVETDGGLTIVTLDEATQKRGGIETRTLSRVKQQSEEVVYGSVIDLQPLIDLHARYGIAAADLAAARAAASTSEQEAKRSRALFQDDNNVSLRTVQAAQAAWTADRAKVQAAEANLVSVRTSALQQFGAPLTHLIAGTDEALVPFFGRQDRLLRIVLPLGTDAAAPPRIDIDDGAGHRVAAHLISESPQSDPLVAGRPFLYRVAANLPMGSRVIAYRPSGPTSNSGVLIPADAVLWFGGQPWVYVLQGKDHFARRPIADTSPSDGGYFASAGFQPGERVVTRGAQLLLSEEQRPPPGSVAACKDPECDD